jgi:hypothetical protein
LPVVGLILERGDGSLQLRECVVKLVCQRRTRILLDDGVKGALYLI